jgi:hypothetical protein
VATVAAEKLIQWADVVGDWHVTAVSAGSNGDILIVASEHRMPTRDDIRHGLWSGPRLTDARLYVVSSTKVLTVDLPRIEGWYWTPQPFGSDRWIVQPSTREERRLFVIEAGTIVGTIDPGDAPNHVETTSDQQIWLGYSDESIFGGSELAAQGVVRLDPDGRPQFRLIDHFRQLGDETGITDCYALNVVSDREVWVNFLNGGWELLRIVDDDIVGRWKNIPIWTATGLAIGDGCVVLAKSSIDASVLYSGRPDTQEFRRWQPVDANRGAIRFIDEFGRGSRLYLSTSDALYVVDARDLSC